MPSHEKFCPGRSECRDRNLIEGCFVHALRQLLGIPTPDRASDLFHLRLGPAAYIGRARVVPLRNIGAAISPFNAWQILQGIETLGLRVDRISDNALAIARHLERHAKVGWVNYAGLQEHPDHGLLNKYLSGKASGILTFGVKAAPGDGRAAGARFLDALQLFTRLVNIGDTKSLATHPRPRRTASCRPPSSTRRGSARTPCACRSASSTSMT